LVEAGVTGVGGLPAVPPRQSNARLSARSTRYIRFAVKESDPVQSTCLVEGRTLARFVPNRSKALLCNHFPTPGRSRRIDFAGSSDYFQLLSSTVGD
jgi:hypothetical protein